MDITSLRRRLQDAPFDFLTAASSLTLPHFDKEWHSLCKDVERASAMLLLSNEDISLARATASQVAVWGELFLDTNDEAVKRTASFMDEVENIFSRLSVSDVEKASTPSIYHHRKPHSTSCTPPTYIPTAYAWIMENIHDPYPPSDIKHRISQNAGRPLRVVTDWFKDARRHIGWVSMCKNHFQGSRACAVQAAKHVYLRSSSVSSPLSSDIIIEFEAIRTRLWDMYPLDVGDGDLSDSTDDSFTSPPIASRGSFSGHSPYVRSSRSSSSTPSLVFSTDDEDNHSLASFVPSDVPASVRKRKILTDEDEFRPLKRNRSGFIDVTDRLANPLVTVPSTVSGTLRSGDTPLSSSLSPQPTSSRKQRLSVAANDWEHTNSITSTSSSKCDPRPPLRMPKRRLSVSDSQPIPKRPCLLAVRPRKQAVSTPVPIAHQTTPTTDEWFPFELPDTSLSVELFNWDAVVENDVFLYNSLFDNIHQTDGQDPSTVTPISDAYKSPTLDLGGSSAVDPSVLDISLAFTEPPSTQLTVPISTPSGPTTATTTPVFDFLDAFLSAVNAESAEPHTSSSPSTELSLNDAIDLFGE